jgi:hypothetical protein
MFRHIWLTALFVLCLAPEAFAQAVADNMTCAQAVSTYERNGRIYKLAHGKDVIPIYNGVPVSQKNRLVCDWGYIRTAYYTKTLDNKRCVISYRCTPSGIGRDR